MFSVVFVASLFLSPANVIPEEIGRISTGDVITMPIPKSAIPEDAFHFPFRVYDQALNVRFSVWFFQNYGMVAIDSQHNLTVWTGASLNLSQYDASFHWLRDWKLNEEPAAFVTDDSGHAYALGYGGYLSVIGVDGKVDHMFRPPDVFYAAGNIDLAPDQCTLFYIDSWRHVRRFDVCRNAPLQNYSADISGEYLRTLSDGGIAVKHGQTINFYDTTGRLTYTFTLPSPWVSEGFTFDSAPGSIWLVSKTGALKVRLSDAGQLLFLETASGRDTLAVAGEFRPSSTNVIPAPRQRSVRR
jgi:hypothetical protein